MKKEYEWKYIFGPVSSRRLGRSLGVDVTPLKTCSYDCIYCQLGETTLKTVKKDLYVPLEGVLAELRMKLESGMEADYITFAGSGEPTLYSELGRLISEIKKMTDIPVAVLTNGSLLWDESVRDSLLSADLVVPSLDAWDEGSFRYVNQPDESLTFDKMLDGIISFRHKYKGEFALEVFLIKGYPAELLAGVVVPEDCRRCTDDKVLQEGVFALREIIGRIMPDVVQLNSVARPTVGRNIAGVPEVEMECIAEFLRSGKNITKVEVVGAFVDKVAPASAKADKADVMNLILRHPCSTAEVACSLRISAEESEGYLRQLTKDGLLDMQEVAGKTFYIAKKQEHK